MDFSQVKAITIPEGNVLRILSGATVLWERTGLPAEYQEVEYLESTGTQYIDTGIVLNNGCVITLDFLMAESAVNRIVYGWRRKGAHTNSYQAYITSNTSKIRQIVIGRSSTDTYPQSFEYDVRNKVLIDSVDEQVLVNDTVIDCGANFNNGRAFDENGSSEYHPYLFALNNAGRAVAISEDTRIYGYSVQYEGELLQSFVPCYRKIDKVAGMYDVVNGVFYTNAGTGKFNVGADVIVLPADYQRVEYIGSAGREYIDLGIKGTENTKVDIAFQVTGSNNFLPFGARRDATRNAFAIWGQSGTVGSNLRIGFDNTAGYTGSATTRDKYHIIFGKEGAFVNDTNVWTPVNYRSFETPGTLLVFGYRPTPTSISLCGMKLFTLKLWENNVLTRDFIPCYRKIDNVAGLYDIANDVFYPNAGTGEFTVGPDIITIPSGYQKVEYIQSSGTQYIQTSVAPSDNFRMDLRTYTTCGDSYYCAGVRASGKIYFGQTGTTTNNRVSASVNGTSVNASTDGVQWSRSTSGQTYEIMLCTNGNGTFTYHIKDLTNNKESLTENREYTLMGEVTNSVCLFALNRNYIVSGTNQIYYFRLYKNGEVAFDGIPCYRKSDNVVGLYDLVSKTLLVNAGTGSFVAGPDV